MSDTEDLRPLKGVRVIDASTFIAAPFCATLLGEFGAEVIKVELPFIGDPLRKFGSVDTCGETFPWLSESRNKKSVTLDLRTPEGASLFKELIRKSDVLCENFQTGTLESWGLGWEDLKSVNPGLVMLRITGYGQTGPNASKPGFGRIGNAFSGLSFLAGYPESAPVTPGSATLADYMSGLFGAFGVMLALKSVEKYGKGQVIDIGLYESIFRVLDELVPAYDRLGYIRQRMGPGTVNAVPHSHYPTIDGKWVAIACTSDKIYSRLAVVLGRPETANDGIYGTYPQRELARKTIDSMVEKWTSSKTLSQILAECDSSEIPCGPVYSIKEIFEDLHYEARENIVRIADDRLGTIAVPNVVPKLSETPGHIEWLGPPLGAQENEIYGKLLGLTEEYLSLLRDKKIIGK